MKRVRVLTINEQIANLVDVIAHLLNAVNIGDGWCNNFRYMEYTFNNVDDYEKFVLKCKCDTSIIIRLW